VDEVFVAYMELRNLSPENFTRVERLRRLYEMVAENILQDGIQSGDFRLADPRIAALGLIAMLTGVPTWYRSGGRLSTQEIQDIYIAMALGAAGATVTPTPA